MVYEYSISLNTANGAINSAKLAREIQSSAIVTAFDRIDTSGDLISVFFKAFLSVGDELLLDSVVAAHDGVIEFSADQVEVKNELTIKAHPPFARPDYRTKRSATASIVDVAPGESVAIDYILPEERFVTGGEIIHEGSALGDYVTAEVHDVYGLIPEQFRAALCEAWPMVARYVEKVWINPHTNSRVIETYPLNAKITQGLALRVTYHAVNSGATRKVAVNYHLTKSLLP